MCRSGYLTIELKWKAQVDLPGHITEENILREQSARNPKLVRLINKFPEPPNKDVGEGLNTAFEAMRKLRLEEPEIEEGEHSVTVYIRHTPLASAHDTVMAYLDTNGEITNRVARELTGIRSENSMKNVFLKLKERNMNRKVRYVDLSAHDGMNPYEGHQAHLRAAYGNRGQRTARCRLDAHGGLSDELAIYKAGRRADSSHA
jgi:hypothetical protein